MSQNVKSALFRNVEEFFKNSQIQIIIKMRMTSKI